MPFFTVHHRSKKSKARIATIQTSHGGVQTPTFVPCATKGTLKGVTPELIPQLNAQLMFVNTYHLVTHPGSDIVQKAGGIHAYAKLPTVLMSDSGGFQVFSLGKSARSQELRVKRASKLRGDTSEEPLLVKIDENGVKFRSTYDGKLIEFTPESSIQFQKEIGADLLMAFDECTYLEANEKYTKKSMNRTHDWLLRCIKAMNHTSEVSDSQFTSEVKIKKQYLYGIIQGGQFENLRKASAEFVSKQDVDGVAIGGVSVGETKKQMREQVEWCSPFLPDNKPVHLLGVGQLDDIRDVISYGIDTFDCVEPTRIARTGRIYQWNGDETVEIDILKSSYLSDMSKLDSTCDCYTCSQFSKSYVHHLFKQKELLGYTLATIHNVYTVERYVSHLRDLIQANKL